MIDLKDFIVKSINYFGWESNLSIRPPRSFKYYLEVLLDTNQWEILNWKTAYSWILVNNTMWVSSQLFGCGWAKPGPLGRVHLHHLMFITELLLVWPVGHIDPLLRDWATKPSQVPWNGNPPTWMWRLNLQSHSQYSLFCGTKWQRNGNKFLKNLQTKDGHFEIT